MELVPEEKLVVITTEEPILSPRNENGDFDVDSSLEIELTLIISISLLFLVKSTLKFEKT